MKNLKRSHRIISNNPSRQKTLCVGEIMSRRVPFTRLAMIFVIVLKMTLHKLVERKSLGVSGF